MLVKITKYGVEAFAPEGYCSEMPAFEKVLGDNEIKDVIEFIKSIWPDAIRRRQERRNAPAVSG